MNDAATGRRRRLSSARRRAADHLGLEEEVRVLVQQPADQHLLPEVRVELGVVLDHMGVAACRAIRALSLSCVRSNPQHLPQHSLQGERAGRVLHRLRRTPHGSMGSAPAPTARHRQTIIASGRQNQRGQAGWSRTQQH